MYNYLEITGNNGYKISLKVWESKKTDRVIIACHGFAGDKESGAISMVAEAMLKHNVTTIAFDLPGHGESEVDGDKLTIDNCLSDYRSVIDYAKEKYKEATINLFATSFGGYLTLLLLNRYPRDYENVILRCPAIKMDECLMNEIIQDKKFEEGGFVVVGFERELKVNYSFYQELKDNKIFDLYQKNDQKMLIIHGDADTTAPTADSLKFSEMFDVPIKIVKGADHRFKKPGELEQVVKYTEEFIG